MLSLEQVSYQYTKAKTCALNGVSLALAPGEIVGLLGPNGAGKTTLISLLSGTLALQQGRITVDGLPFARSRSANPATISLAPQALAFYPTLTVIENLTFFGQLASKQSLAARRDRALAFCQLQQFTQQQARSLSGGLQRRLNLAITLMSAPRYLLLDEPTVGVDPQSRAFILDSVKRLAQDGMGIIYTSHYMAEVEALADRLVIMDHGQVLQQGTLDSLLAQHNQLSIRQRGVTHAAARQLLGQWAAVVEDTHSADAMHILLKPGVGAGQVLAKLEGAGANISQIDYGKPDLASLFLGLTHRALRD
jgi:ABC-2 type transport system ATP-binding protein